MRQRVLNTDMQEEQDPQTERDTKGSFASFYRCFFVFILCLFVVDRLTYQHDMLTITSYRGSNTIYFGPVSAYTVVCVCKIQTNYGPAHKH